ncbi:MAG: site-specific integrase, partial [candidate division NC10 bacterium]|nr:site-specific integrase [candidate division NC10 bacterium]
MKRRPTVLLEVEAQAYLALAKATKRGYPRERSALKKLCQAPEFARKTLDTIRFADVERYVARRCEAKGRPATLHRDLAVLRHLYNLAIRDGKVDQNPLKGVKLPKVSNARARYLTEEEERHLFAVLPDSLKPLVIVAF